MTTFYLAGPMRGLPMFNFPAFDEAAAWLRRWNHTVLSPAEMDRDRGFDETAGTIDGFDMDAALADDLAAIRQADAVVLLPGWEHSEGVSVEIGYARLLDKQLYEYHDNDMNDQRLWPLSRSAGSNVNPLDVEPAVPAADKLHYCSERCADDNCLGAGPCHAPNGGPCLTPGPAGAGCGDSCGCEPNNNPPAEVTMSAQWPAEILRAYGGPVVPADDQRPAVVTTGETVVVDPTTGGRKGAKPAQLGAVHPGALLALAKVAGFGADKYERYNFLRGYRWSLSFDALMRHALAYWGGEDRDPESGHNHMAHVAWHALALVAFAQNGAGLDDRPPVYVDGKAF